MRLVFQREFFDVSQVSFVHGLSVSIKEGYLLKRSHDDYRGHSIFFRLPFFCDACKFHHGRKYVLSLHYNDRHRFYCRWFIIKDSYITYMRPDTYEIRFPMLVDRGFEIMTGFRHVKTQHGIKIINLQRTLVLKCRNSRDCEEWTQHLMDLKERAKSFVAPTVNRFNSFAPIRKKQLAYWYETTINSPTGLFFCVGLSMESHTWKQLPKHYSQLRKKYLLPIGGCHQRL